MATLEDQHRRFIVIQLARFRRVKEIREAVKEEFGLELDRQQVHYYDPTSSTGRTPAQKWVELYQESRKAYIDNPEKVDVAHERFRLEKLSDIARKRLEAGDHQTAMKALKQAAKERGQAFTNVRDLQSKGDKLEQPPDIFVYGGEQEEPEPEEAQDDGGE